MPAATRTDGNGRGDGGRSRNLPSTSAREAPPGRPASRRASPPLPMGRPAALRVASASAAGLATPPSTRTPPPSRRSRRVNERAREGGGDGRIGPRATKVRHGSATSDILNFLSRPLRPTGARRETRHKRRGHKRGKAKRARACGPRDPGRINYTHARKTVAAAAKGGGTLAPLPPRRPLQPKPCHPHRAPPCHSSPPV